MKNWFVVSTYGDEIINSVTHEWRTVNRCSDIEKSGSTDLLAFHIMISKLITLLIVLFFVILAVGFVLKLVRWGITLAVIVGIAALILHFVKKKG